jgi:glucose/arabinose dehydrogenase
LACLSLLILLASLAGCGGGHGGGTATDDGPTSGNLPPEFESLAAGFSVAKVAAVDTPAKMVEAPDGRVFVSELSGHILIFEADGTPAAVPFATLDVVSGGERGLLGLAFSPDFANDHSVYAFVCRESPAHNQVVRLIDQGGVGADETVIVDDLPQGQIHNGGDLLFLDDGTLLVSVGENGDMDRAQTDGDTAGRVLRYNADGSIPSDNPIPGDPEYCRGLRNTYDLARHPTTGVVFGLDEGPTSDDELNVIKSGKNFGWPELPPSWPGSRVGVRLYVWEDVITPTAVTVHDGKGFGAEYANNLFLCSYNFCEVRRLPMSGDQFTDVDDEQLFARLWSADVQNKPLSIIEHQDGSLWVGTFSAIWKITKDG